MTNHRLLDRLYLRFLLLTAASMQHDDQKRKAVLRLYEINKVVERRIEGKQIFHPLEWHTDGRQVIHDVSEHRFDGSIYFLFDLDRDPRLQSIIRSYNYP